jgi:hypothetical protein
MRRVSILGSLAVALLVLAAVGFAGRSTVAQEDATPVATTHPLVGVWVIDTDVDDPTNGPGVVTVGADGIWHEVDSDGTSGFGAWRATGARTAEVVFVYPGEEGTVLIRATIEVAEDGRSFTAPYTVEFVSPDGTATGQYGPGSAVANRLDAEAPGPPVGTLEDLFGSSAASPAAGTPAP